MCQCRFSTHWLWLVAKWERRQLIVLHGDPTFDTTGMEAFFVGMAFINELDICV